MDQCPVCTFWASTNVYEDILHGHHAECPHRHPLTDAQREEGIRRIEALLGIMMNEDAP